MPIARVRTSLTGIVEGGGVSTHYFDAVEGSADPDVLILAVREFWLTISEAQTTQVTMQVQNQVDLLNTADGTLLETVFGTTSNPVTGYNNAEPMPPAAQALLRLRTSRIVNGRRLLGKLFIPGITTDQTTPRGETDEGLRTLLNGAASALALATGSDPWVVWSKKNGLVSPVISGSTWEKFAVLRTRRD